jgi:hypothetical protein
VGHETACPIDPPTEPLKGLSSGGSGYVWRRCAEVRLVPPPRSRLAGLHHRGVVVQEVSGYPHDPVA